MWAYVVIFDGIERSDFIERLRTFPNRRVARIVAYLPQTVFIASPVPARDLSTFLRRRFPEIERILVLDAQTDRNGWLPQAAWQFFRDAAEED